MRRSWLRARAWRGPAGSANGPFKSLFDFCVRVERSKLNKRTVEALIKAGAFDAVKHEPCGVGGLH